MKNRALKTKTLNDAAKYWAAQFLMPTRVSRNNPDLAVAGREYTMQSFYNATFKDEFEHLKAAFRHQLGADPLKEFDALARKKFSPRKDEMFEKLLAQKLAINPAGEHIKGLTGTTQVGGRVIGIHPIEVETRESLAYRRKRRLSKVDYRKTEFKMIPKRVPIFAGEVEEHGHRNIADFIADQSGAVNTNISAAIAILALDALVDGLDGGTGAAIIRGYTAAQPADPDVAIGAQTLLFTLVCTDPAFGGAADESDGTIDADAAAITDDGTADDTDTLAWLRAHSTNDGATPLDDHIDGSAGTSDADWIFNTLAIVAGATVSASAWTITLDQGPSAT